MLQGVNGCLHILFFLHCTEFANFALNSRFSSKRPPSPPSLNCSFFFLRDVWLLQRQFPLFPFSHEIELWFFLTPICFNDTPRLRRVFYQVQSSKKKYSTRLRCGAVPVSKQKQEQGVKNASKTALKCPLSAGCKAQKAESANQASTMLNKMARRHGLD